jgi:hypothetical protein
VAEDVMRAFVVEEEDLQFVGERVEAPLVQRDDRHAVHDAGVGHVAKIIHLDGANRLAAKVAAGELLATELDARLETAGCIGVGRPENAETA